MNSGASTTDIKNYVESGWWEKSKSLSDIVSENAGNDPSGLAYISDVGNLNWDSYHHWALAISEALLTMTEVGDRVLVWMPDSGGVHAAYLGCERAGIVVVGVGWRAGLKELAYLADSTGSQFLLSIDETPLGEIAQVAGKLGIGYLTVDKLLESRGEDPLRNDSSPALMGPSDLWFINSTSGTTGLPKCVMQTQNRWFYFHKKAVDFGNLSSEEIWMSVVPSPFGFGLWTAHFTPTLLGVPCVVQEKFNARKAAELIEKHAVTVLCAVSSQFVMILDESQELDLSSLNIVFTGGEAISPQRAEELEKKSGCKVLNFYGSNETGTLSGTTIYDPPNKRHTTGGQIIPEMEVRLYDPETGKRLGNFGVGQPACKGPALSLGYWEDAKANKELMTDDGWFLMGDLVEIDDKGWLKVVGRTSDFIIRGGKNISSVAVEREVEAHPKVALAAVVAKPHKKLGETAVACVQLHKGQSLTIGELKDFLREKGVTIDWWPETLEVMDELPLSSGGKVAKGELKKLFL